MLTYISCENMFFTVGPLGEMKSGSLGPERGVRFEAADCSSSEHQLPNRFPRLVRSQNNICAFDLQRRRHGETWLFYAF